jgi:signal transduction histidine kinase
VAVAIEPAPEADARAVLMLLPCAVVTVDGEWRITLANPEAHRLLGEHGATLWELCPELEATPLGSALRYAMADRAELINDATLPAVGWVQVRARPYDTGLVITLRPLVQEALESVQAKQALLVGELGYALTERTELRAMLQACTDAIVRHLGAHLARVWTVDAGRHELVLQASSGEGEPELPERVALGRAKVGKIVERGTPHLTNDFMNDPRAGNREWAQREGIVAFAGYPLRVDTDVAGVLAVYSTQPLGHDTTGMLATAADAIALGIERKLADDARRHAEAELRAKAEQLELINEIGKNLTSDLEIVTLAQRVTNLATRLTGARFGAFYFEHDKSTDQLGRIAVAGAPREAFPLPLRPTQLGPATLGAQLPTASFLSVPVIARGGTLVGAFVFGHELPGRFGEPTASLLAGVAAQAAIAMDNARLFASARELIDALERTNAELDQFAYVTSHDLNAPLRGIANLSQWIEDDLGDRMDDEGRHHMALLRGRVTRLERLIDGILSYSRAARSEDDVVEVDVAALAGELWELIAPPSTARLTVHELPRLRTQRTPLQQVLLNLIGNAVKYNADAVHVEVGAREEDGGWTFYVRDDGVGIAPEFQERIWGLFQTLEPRDKVESTGIGLAVVRKIVEAHGGRAWVESDFGAGATFWFTWPHDRIARKKRHG